jgi:hypothetical protein
VVGYQYELVGVDVDADVRMKVGEPAEEDAGVVVGLLLGEVGSGSQGRGSKHGGRRHGP